MISDLDEYMDGLPKIGNAEDTELEPFNQRNYG